MATPNAKIQLGGLARKLVQDGIIDESSAINAQTAAIKSKIPFVTYIVQQKLADSFKIAEAASTEFGVPVVNLDAVDIEADVIKLVKESLVRKHNTLPLFKRGNRLFIAVSDPTLLQAIDEVKFHVGMSTEAILVEEDKLQRVINKSMEDNDTSLSELTDGDYDDLDYVDEDAEANADDGADSDIDDAPVVRFVNKVLLDAINKGASDIHFEPYEKNYRVRFRLDGVLNEVATLRTVLSIFVLTPVRLSLVKK